MTADDADDGILPLSVSTNDQRTVSDNAVYEDFESAADTWGVSGSLESSISIGEKDGNHYLKIQGSKLATQTATKNLEGVPDNLGAADVSFTFINNGLTSGSGSARAGRMN